VSFRAWGRVLMATLLFCAAMSLEIIPLARAQQESARRVQTKVAPVYPELARRMKIVGVVKLEIVVAPNGSVKDIKIVGGHPLLANAVVDAVRKWRYEAASRETIETLEFRFDPNQ
jgi:TonB family protein